MLIYLPDEKVMFMGDVIMPYLGAPFAQEGDLEGLLDAIDVIVSRNPQHLLQGHEPLTRNFSSLLILSHLKTDLTWLQDQVLAAIRRGDDRAAIHDTNLVPPDFLATQPDAYQPYYILREHVIDRLYDQNVGYWQANLQGLAHPSRTDHAELLVDYLGVSEGQILKAGERLSADGKYAMAAELLETAEPKFPHSEALKNAKRFAYLKLMEKNQNTDPFKFIIYSAKAGEQTRRSIPKMLRKREAPHDDPRDLVRASLVCRSRTHRLRRQCAHNRSNTGRRAQSVPEAGRRSRSRCLLSPRISRWLLWMGEGSALSAEWRRYAEALPRLPRDGR
jgi:alkyl sulfatase BDS1-like metallo-beta-lactamase superfamily hydrolase